MQSKQSTLKKTFRRVFPLSSGIKEPDPVGLNPDSSEPIGAGGDIAVNAIQTSLGILKEASALASKIPYIAPIAGLLLQVLQMRDEVKQFKDEWGIVMQKVASIASVVVDVGESAQIHDLKEEDLPADLRDTLRSLQSDLHGIEGALRECADVRGMKKIILRTDMLRKVKQYDARLSSALQLVQTRLAFRIRLAQIVQERQVIHAGINEITTSETQEPRSPQLFFGRDAELAQIVDMIFANIRFRPARIVILGPGGYGKTTLASAVLTHHQIQEHYRDARYFVACESVFSSGALLIELAKTLGILHSGSDASWPHIRARLNARECILCLDNFESPWDQADSIRSSVEELLSRITELHHTTVLITMRGTIRPAQTQWTRPPLAPLRTLGHDAAREIWEHITDDYDTSAEELIKAVDHVPLAVSLLAHLAQATSSSSLLKEWNEKHTGLVQMGHGHKLSSLEYSIRLSINSERMRAHPSAKSLLGALSMLPDGIHVKQLERFQGILIDMNVTLNLRVLQQCSLITVIGERYQTHPIIRHFCHNQGFVSSRHEGPLLDFYVTLASFYPHDAKPSDYAEMVLEVNNTKAILYNLLKANYRDKSRLINAILAFTSFHINIGDLSDKLIRDAVEFAKQQHSPQSLLVRCLDQWGYLYHQAGDVKNAQLTVQEAERLCSFGAENGSALHADILSHLAKVYQFQYAYHEAEAAYQRALGLHEATNDALGQGNDHQGLGDIYQRQSRPNEAEASYLRALEFHKAGNSALNQGNVYCALGNTYHQLNKLKEAEAAFHRALEFHEAVHDIIWQGNDYQGLGITYTSMNRLDEAESSLKKALEFHKAANVILNQGNDYGRLGETYFIQKKFDEAETSFQRALELYEAANDALGQGTSFNGLGRVYVKMEMLDKAKSMFEKALNKHRQVESKDDERLDLWWLNWISNGIGQVS